MISEDLTEKFHELLKKEKYRQRIVQMALEEEKSFTVDFEDVQNLDEELAKGLIEKPNDYLLCLKQAAYWQLRIEDPEYAEDFDQSLMRIRIPHLPNSVPLKQVGSKHLHNLIMVEGIVDKKSSKQIGTVQAVFRCKRCGEKTSVKQKNYLKIKKPIACSNPTCRRKGAFDFISEESSFIDVQPITMTSNAGYSLTVRLYDEDVNKFEEDERIQAVGILRINKKLEHFLDTISAQKKKRDD